MPNDNVDDANADVLDALVMLLADGDEETADALLDGLEKGAGESEEPGS